jgi:aspartate aminotransferase-like enzyme
MGIELWAASEAIAADTNTTLIGPAGRPLQEVLDLLRERYSVACVGTTFAGNHPGATIRLGHPGTVQTEPRFILRLLRPSAWRGRTLGADVDVRAARRILRAW